MRYGSVCSGIEAATMAWHALGWEPAFFSEIEAFPRAVLEHRYPAVPLHGDFTTIEENQYGKIDLLVGGTPCQSFSVAGLRGGLDDERGNLALEFCRLAQRERPRWIVWENVPGVLSSNGGRDFGSILGALAELGYGLAYRVLDAQYFGVAQRRRRVFVVGYLGDWRRAAAVLFERHSLSGHPAPRREARKDAASGPASGADSGGGSGRERLAVEWPAAVSNTLDTDFAIQERAICENPNAGPDGIGARTDTKAYVAIAFSSGDCGQDAAADISPTIRKGGEGGGNPPAIAIQERAICENPNAGPDSIGVRTDDAAYTLEARTVPQAVGYRTTGNAGAYETGDKIGALTTSTDPNAQIVAFTPQTTKPQAVAFQQNTRDEVRYIGGDGQIAGALAAQSGMKQTNYVAYPINTQLALRGPDTSNTSRVGVGEKEEQAPTLRAGSTCHVAIGFDAYNNDVTGDVSKTIDTGQDYHHVPNVFAFSSNMSAYDVQTDGTTPTLKLGGHGGGNPPAVAFDLRGRDGGSQLEGPHDTANIRAASGGSSRSYVAASAVRRLTPVECERLQGFPDGFTAIPWRKKGAEDCPDGPRYKALGNSMAVPVMRWIGERIQMIEDLTDVL